MGCRRSFEGKIRCGPHRNVPKGDKAHGVTGSATDLKRACKQVLGGIGKQGLDINHPFQFFRCPCEQHQQQHFSDTKYPTQNQLLNLNPLQKLNLGFREHNSSLCKFLPIKLTKHIGKLLSPIGWILCLFFS